VRVTLGLRKSMGLGLVNLI